MINNIPKELAELKQWCGHGGKNKPSKAPLIKVNEIHKAKKLSELSLDNGFGIILSAENDYAIIDIDSPKNVKEIIKSIAESTSADDYTIEELVNKHIIDNLPSALQGLIGNTYSELSMSKAGVHVVIRVDKSKLPQRAYIKGTKFEGQLSLSNNFMVMTGNKISYSPDTIATVDAETINELFSPNEQKTEIASEQPWEPEKLPPLGLIESALNLCKLDQSAYIKKIYNEVTGEVYEHYNYWLIIGMALHDYAVKSNQKSRVYSLFLAWSQTDESAYTGEKDVEAKWNSFGNSNSTITYKTLMRFASLLEYDYPRPQVDKRGRKLGIPINVEYVNFQYLLDRHDIKIHDGGPYGYFLTGEKETLDKYFRMPDMRDLFGYLGPFDRQQLLGSTLRLCQDSRYRGLSNTCTLVDTWLTTPKPELDFFKLWLDTDENDLPEELQYITSTQGRKHISTFNANSTFDYILDCIEWNTDSQNSELSEKMLYKTFMQLIKFHEKLETPFSDNGGFLAFIGPENTYKTTFFKMILPQSLSFLRKELNMPVVSDKGIRDFIRYLGTKAIVQIDEFEGFLDQKKLGPILKAIISGNNMSFTDIYQTSEAEMIRKAIIVGTSNEKKHILSANGSRRMWLCEVKRINTNKLLDFNWHKFYRDMREEFRKEVSVGKTPWLMSYEDTVKTTVRNEGLAAKSEIDMLLEELFPYDEPINYYDFKEPIRLWSTVNTKRYISLITGSFNISLPHLERALERFCGTYTDTYNEPQTRGEGKSKTMVSRGLLLENHGPSGWRTKRWILPPKRDE